MGNTPLSLKLQRKRKGHNISIIQDVNVCNQESPEFFGIRIFLKHSAGDFLMHRFNF
jgi:hypothetical protein